MTRSFKVHLAAQLAFLLISTTLLVSCSKDYKLSNLSNIYVTDNMGNLIDGDPSDGQWQAKTFTESEMALFASLDTADALGTIKPASLNTRYALPNPFVHQIGVPVSLDSDYNAMLLLKYVIVDKSMKTVQSGVHRMEARASSFFSINPTFSSGRYRIYFTFSAEGEKHYYKSWGNIEHQ